MASSSAFKLISRTRANGLVEVRKYISQKSGLKLTVADVEGPMVNGYLCLATETDTDEGLPHTLEHLVFMGSRNYPYKGVLDLLANRCLASGTNAWTDTDHTCYTLSTAGQEGFIKLLPIYLDHILQPMMTESQFMTEVHHITGEGQDGGVVYCEMQEHETKMSEMTGRAICEGIYPDPACCYRYETGGRLGPLRETCSNVKVLDFHRKLYRPENLNIIVTGPVNEEKLFESIIPVEADAINNMDYSGAYVRPWQSPVKPLLTSTNEILKCPADDVTKGLVRIAWRGPKAENYYEESAVNVLLEYLYDTAVSPFQRDFIQRADPLCSSVGASLTENSECCLEIRFNGVPTESLKSIQPALFETLNGLIAGKESIDMDRMQDILFQSVLRSYSSMETSAHETVSDALIGDFLYGNTEEHFTARCNNVQMYKDLKKEPSGFWVELIKKFINPDKPYVSVIGEPSADAIKEFSAAEELRIKARCDKLGEDGLEKMAQRLEQAVDENEEAEPPEELIEKMVVNSLDGINFVSLKSSSSLSMDADNNPTFPLSGLPFTAMLDDAKTNFVQLTAVMNTESVPAHLRPLLLLWKSMLFETAIERDGVKVPYEKVVKELNRDLVDYSAGVGLISRGFNRYAHVTVKIDAESYPKGVNWLKDFLNNVQFDEDRIRIVAKKIANSAATKKRDGNSVAKFLLHHLLYQKGSNPYLHSALRMEKLYESISESPEKIVKDMNELRDLLSDSKGLSLHIACNTEKLSAEHAEKIGDLSSPLGKLIKSVTGGKDKFKFGDEPYYMAEDGKGKGAVIPIGSCEAAHVIRVCQGMRNALDSDLPALALFLQYLSQCEGPLWREIRGNGLAYGANIYESTDAGLIFLSLYRTADPVRALQQTTDIVNKILSGDSKLDDAEFEAAKRSLVFEVIDREDTVSSASSQSLLSYVRQVPHTYNQDFCKAIWDKSAEETLAAAKKWLPPLLSAVQSTTAITCHPSKLNDIVQGFSKMGQELKQMTLEDAELSWKVE